MFAPVLRDRSYIHVGSYVQTSFQQETVNWLVCLNRYTLINVSFSDAGLANQIPDICSKE